MINEITFLIKEPRGYPCQNLNIVFPSEMPGIDWGYIICEQECVYPLFSGHNTICVVTALLVSLHFDVTFFTQTSTSIIKFGTMILIIL